MVIFALFCLIEVDDDQALTQMELDYDSFNESVDNNDDGTHDNKIQGMLQSIELA